MPTARATPWCAHRRRGARSGWRRETRPTPWRSARAGVYPKRKTRKGAAPGRAALMPDALVRSRASSATSGAFVALGNAVATPLALRARSRRIWSAFEAATIAAGRRPDGVDGRLRQGARGRHGHHDPAAGLRLRRQRAHAARGGHRRRAATAPGARAAARARITTTDGLAVVAQGTPTNNTDEAIAGWTRGGGRRGGAVRARARRQGLADPAASAAGQLSRALGLDELGAAARRRCAASTRTRRWRR